MLGGYGYGLGCTPIIVAKAFYLRCLSSPLSDNCILNKCDTKNVVRFANRVLSY